MVKSCFCRLETAKNGDWHGTLVALVSIAVSVASRNFSRPRDSSKDNLWRQFAIIFQCSPCILLGCYLLWQRSSLGEWEHNLRGMNQQNDTWKEKEKLFCWRSPLSTIDNFSNNKILQTLTKNICSLKSITSLMSSRVKGKIQLPHLVLNLIFVEFVCGAMAIRRLGAWLNLFSRMNCFCVATMEKLFARVSK